MDPWAAQKAWRKRRAEIAKQQKPTYDAYPGLEDIPAIKFYVEARDMKGRLRRAYVDLDGYAVSQLNWAPGATRGGVRITDWFAGRMLRALKELQVELAKQEQQRKEFNYDPRSGSR